MSFWSTFRATAPMPRSLKRWRQRRRSRSGYVFSAHTRDGAGLALRNPTRASLRPHRVPEIPDLEAIRHFLEPRLRGNPVVATESRFPWLVRTGAAGLDTLVGHEFVTLRRFGKFLLFATN